MSTPSGPSTPSDTSGTGPVLVDSLGKACPIPVIDLAKAVDDVAVGDEVVLLADDPGAKVDIPVWCRMRQQEYLGMTDAERGWSFRVRRAR